MELRFVTSRSTRDLDFTLRAGNTESALDHLQRAGAREIGDFFSFYGGARYPVESRLDGRTFVKFHVDVGIGDVILEPVEVMATRDWLAFAEIAAPSITMIAREQQFAEKIHAYTVPRPSANGRVRDLVDLHLLIASVLSTPPFVPKRCGEHLSGAIPMNFPKNWFRLLRIGIGPLAEECLIDIGYREAFDALLGFWAAL
jgi:hypothetical protein